MSGSGLDCFDNLDPATSNARRPYIGVLFECCGVYARVYRQPDQPWYAGRCPRCLRTMRVRVGQDGTNARLFRAT
jgi:hypothetical protein